MPELRCTVRDCALRLEPGGGALRCGRGHAVDRARPGSWNLLQPQDRRSRRAGDSDEATAARRRWLARGHVAGLVREIAARIDAVSPPEGGLAVDVGCGEGTLTAQLLASRPLDVCGVDLATGAIRLAARTAESVTWIVANADRGLPFMSASVDLAVSIFGRRPAEELRRVLKPKGALIVVVPGEDDLVELREAAQGPAPRRSGAAGAAAELAPHFTVKETALWRHQAHHDREALADALAMSYRGARLSERERMVSVVSKDVTLAAAILTLVPAHGVR